MSTAPARPSGLPVAVLLRSFRVIPQAMGLLREAVPKNEGFRYSALRSQVSSQSSSGARSKRLSYTRSQCHILPGWSCEGRCKNPTGFCYRRTIRLTAFTLSGTYGSSLGSVLIAGADTAWHATRSFHFATIESMLLEPTGSDRALRIIIGAGEQSYDGWIPTQKEDLDLLDPTTWERSLEAASVDAFLCEHVWEHLTESEGHDAARLWYRYLRPGGYIRCAVPDGNFRKPEYQELVQVGGNGDPDSPAADHKILYTYSLLTEVFEAAGFQVSLLEYCDGDGVFRALPWSPDDGPIYRSLATDHRNQDGTIEFASLIIDAVKPLLTVGAEHDYRQVAEFSSR